MLVERSRPRRKRTGKPRPLKSDREISILPVREQAIVEASLLLVGREPVRCRAAARPKRRPRLRERLNRLIPEKIPRSKRRVEFETGRVDALRCVVLQQYGCGHRCPRVGERLDDALDELRFADDVVVHEDKDVGIERERDSVDRRTETEVLLVQHECDLRKALRDELARSIRGGVVDHVYVRAKRLCGEALQGLCERVAPVDRRDDDRDSQLRPSFTGE